MHQLLRRAFDIKSYRLYHYFLTFVFDVNPRKKKQKNKLSKESVENTNHSVVDIFSDCRWTAAGIRFITPTLDTNY